MIHSQEVFIDFKQADEKEQIKQQLKSLKSVMIEHSAEIEKILNLISEVEKKSQSMKEESDRDSKENMDIVKRELENLCSNLDRLELNVNSQNGKIASMQGILDEDFSSFMQNVKNYLENMQYEIEKINEGFEAHKNSVEKEIDNKIEKRANELDLQFLGDLEDIRKEVDLTKKKFGVDMQLTQSLDKKLTQLTSDFSKTTLPEAEEMKKNIEIAMKELNTIQTELRSKENIIPQLIENIEHNRKYFEREIENVKNDLNLKIEEKKLSSNQEDGGDGNTDLREGIRQMNLNINSLIDSIKYLDSKTDQIENELTQIKEKKSFSIRKSSLKEKEEMNHSQTPFKIRVSNADEDEMMRLSEFGGKEGVVTRTSVINKEEQFEQPVQQPIDLPFEQAQPFQPQQTLEGPYTQSVTVSNIATQNKIIKFQIIDDLKHENIIPTHEKIFSLLYLNIEKSSPQHILVTGHKDGMINHWDIRKFRLISSFYEHKGIVDDLREIKSTQFISVSRDNSIKLWDINSKTSLKTFFNDSWASCLSSLKNFKSDCFATGDENSNIKIWSAGQESDSNSLETIPSGHKNGISRILFLSEIPNCNMLLSASCPDIKLWNINTKHCIRSYEGHNGWINCLIFLKAELFCSASGDRTIRLWNLYCSKCVQVFNIHTTNVATLLHLDDDWILTGSLGKTSKVLDISNGQVLNTYERSEPIYKMEQGLIDDKKVIFGCHWGSKDIKIWGNIDREVL